MNTSQELLEQSIIKDLAHSLKLMPGSQRELFAYEVARYVTQALHRQDVESRVDEVEKFGWNNATESYPAYAKRRIKELTDKENK